MDLNENKGTKILNIYNKLFEFYSKLDNNVKNCNGNDNNNVINKYNANDLCIYEPEKEIKYKIDKMWKQWRQLDLNHLNKIEVKLDRSGMHVSYITIPQDFNIYGSIPSLNQIDIDNLNHPRIPEENKKNYLNELTNLFRKVPKFDKLCENINNQDFDTMKLKHSYDNDELKLSQEIKQIQNNAIDNSLLLPRDNNIELNIESRKTNIFTFSIHNPLNDCKQQEIEILGCQNFNDLQDHIYCLQDHICYSESTEDSFFYIGGIYYIDIRHDSFDACKSRLINLLKIDNDNYNINNSNSSSSSKKKRKRNYIDNNNSLIIKPMGSIILDDLSLSFHEDYVYRHQYSCPHIIKMVDIRLHNPILDLPNISLYPRETYKVKMKRRKCNVCSIWSATFVVYGDRLVGSGKNPTFFCQHCYHMLHYDSNNNLIYKDFRVFPFLHDMI
jgi:hypothetical protein